MVVSHEKDMFCIGQGSQGISFREVTFLGLDASRLKFIGRSGRRESGDGDDFVVLSVLLKGAFKHQAEVEAHLAGGA